MQGVLKANEVVMGEPVVIEGAVARDRSREVKRANFRLIEKELFHYVARKTEYEALRNDIFNETAAAGEEGPVQRGPGNQTLSRVIRLQSGVMLETARRLAAIEYALLIMRDCAEPAKWELVKLKYFYGRLTDEGIMAKLCVSRDTFYRWRKEFIYLIADRLGWEV